MCTLSFERHKTYTSMVGYKLLHGWTTDEVLRTQVLDFWCPVFCYWKHINDCVLAWWKLVLSLLWIWWESHTPCFYFCRKSNRWYTWGHRSLLQDCPPATVLNSPTGFLSCDRSTPISFKLEYQSAGSLNAVFGALWPVSFTDYSGWKQFLEGLLLFS